MEGKKNVGSSSSSITSKLFGSKDSPPSSSAGIFGSIFAPPSKAQIFGRESLRPAGAKTQHSPNEPWNTKPGASALGVVVEGETDNTENRDKSDKYQEQRIYPCHLSSSIYYGGQDVYLYPQGSQSSELDSVMTEKTIQGVQQEETGGKGLYTTKSLIASQHTYIKVPLITYS
ncbi:hypothetical protein CXB51_023237 [Gossypium anomalum]|uniref:Uncharacterized protein n=1 Tax=Gossypium anomalum TaxID=47600 RepID=A0A8J6CVN2_9ROSI|nr:hypothetical protein CXB51_023237 [Gossypium anomalum]